MIDPERHAEEVSHVPVIQQLAVIGVIMLLIFGTGFAPKFFARFQDSEPTAEINIEYTEDHHTVTTPAQQEIIKQTLDEVTITGQSAFVWDINTQKVLYQKNPDEQLPIASITKLMTALVAYELLQRDDAIEVTISAIRQDGASGFVDGESFTLQSLADLTLVSSSNDGAFALAANVGALLAPQGDASTFVQAMNIRADELGLEQTYFRNPTGLDISDTEAGAYSSARDIAFLLEYILKNNPEVVENTDDARVRVYNGNGAYHAANNTNAAIDELAGLIASKTGYTELAGGNLAIAFDASLNRPVVVVVLGSTRSERFTDVVALTDAIRVITN